MAKISSAGIEDFKNLQNRIRESVKTAGAYEEAAQSYTRAIYDDYKDSVTLIRLFVTLRYETLPPEIKSAVENLSDLKGIRDLLKDQTLVLTLAGSSGKETEWNDRKNSAGHIGIPLVSAAFIDAAPMMSRLLKQLGLGLEWIDSRDTELVKKTMGSMSGMFYVPDAVTEVDRRGRKIIAAQDFVASYGIRTVFGYGGSYLGTDAFFVTIIFLHEALEKEKADQFAGAMTFFKNISGSFLKKMFKNGSGVQRGK